MVLGFGCDFFCPYKDLKNLAVPGEDSAPMAFAHIADRENVTFFTNCQNGGGFSRFEHTVEDCGSGRGRPADVMCIVGHRITANAQATPPSVPQTKQ